MRWPCGPPEAEADASVFGDPPGEPDFEPADAPRFRRYFGADDKGRFFGELHHAFGMSPKGFSGAAKMRLQYHDGPGTPMWFWVPRATPA